MSPEAWLGIFVVASSVLMLVELEKPLLRRLTGIEREAWLRSAGRFGIS